jgi:hypothetical protein
VRAAERRVDLLNREVVISGWVVVAGVVAVGFGLGGFHFEISPADFLGLGTLLILGGGGLFWSMARARHRAREEWAAARKEAERVGVP